MHVFKTLFLPVMMITLLSACAHRVYTARLDANWAIDENRKIGGVPFYEPTYIAVRHRFTQYVIDGSVIANARGEPISCERVTQKEEVRLLPNLRKPVAILSEPSWFASGQMKVTLSESMLASLDASSDPELAELISAVMGAAEPAPAAVTSGLPPAQHTLNDLARKGLTAIPACNASPVVDGFQELELGAAASRVSQ
jgi:hypothetical protein